MKKKLEWYYPNKYQQRSLANCEKDKGIVGEKLDLFKKAFDKFAKKDLTALLGSASGKLNAELKEATMAVHQLENAEEEEPEKPTLTPNPKPEQPSTKVLAAAKEDDESPEAKIVAEYVLANQKWSTINSANYKLK